MGTCFLHGGGGITLPFRVIGGTTQPSNPKDGTIWVKTSQPITAFAFMDTTWSTAAVGQVCVIVDRIGGSNPTGTNNVVWVLNNNIGGIPYRAKATLTGCKQVQGSTGNWVDLCAYVYYKGSWTQFSEDIDWSKWIIKDGTSVYDVVAIGKPEDSSFSPQTLNMTQEDGRIKIVCSGSGTGMVYAGPVDLTGINTVTLEGTFSVGSYADWYYMRAWTKIGNYTLSNSAAAVKLTSTGATLDVSKLSGNHYLGFTTRGNLTQYVTDLYLT